MAKGGAKKTNQMLEGSYNQAQQFSNTQGQRSSEAYGYGTGVRDYVTDKYKAMLEGYGEDGGGGGGGGGGSAYTGDLETMKRLGATSEDQLNRLRGFGVPEEFAKTGGWSDPEQTNFRLRTTASVPGFYDAMRRNLGQRTAVSGGYGPGFDAASMSLAREQARGGAAAALDSENALAESIRSGRKWGAETGAGNERVVYGNQERALQQLLEQERSARAASASAGARSFSEQMALLSGLRGIRGETGAETEYDRLQLAGMGSGLNAANSHMANNPNKSVFDQITGVVGAAAGIAPVFMGGGGTKKKSPAPTPSSSYYDPYMEEGWR